MRVIILPMHNTTYYIGRGELKCEILCRVLELTDAIYPPSCVHATLRKLEGGTGCLLDGTGEKYAVAIAGSIEYPARGFHYKMMGVYGAISPTSPVGCNNPERICGTAGQ